DERFASSRLVLLTRGAVATHADHDAIDLVHAPIWGLVRSAQNENPDRVILLVDIDDTDESRRALVSATVAAEPQLALREGRRLAPRLLPAHARGVLTPPEASAWRLDIEAKGSIEGLALVAHPEVLAPIGENEVRIRVHAAGLNFRD